MLINPCPHLSTYTIICYYFIIIIAQFLAILCHFINLLIPHSGITDYNRNILHLPSVCRGPYIFHFSILNFQFHPFAPFSPFVPLFFICILFKNLYSYLHKCLMGYLQKHIIRFWRNNYSGKYIFLRIFFMYLNSSLSHLATFSMSLLPSIILPCDKIRKLYLLLNNTETSL